MALLCAALGSCSDREASPPWPLAHVRVPSLSCRTPIDSVGECARDADCGEGHVCALDPGADQVDRMPVALRCGAAIGTCGTRAVCESGSDCESGLCGLAGVCLAPCREDDDCILGQTCQPVEAQVPDGLAPVQACARVAAFPDGVSLAVRSAGSLQAHTLNHVEVATRGVVSLFFLKVDCARSLSVVSIEAASGRSLFDLAAQLDGTVQLNPVVNAGALVPLLMPDNPRLDLGSATYSVNVTVDDDAALSLISVSRAKFGRILDLNVFYVGGGSTLQEGGLHAGDPQFRAVLDRLGARYAALGIQLGDVHEYDVEGALRAELGALEVRSQVENDGAISGEEVMGLDRLFGLSAGVDNGGANVFIVRSMGPVLGISGGTPGALGLTGTPLSGVAIALDRVELARADRVLFHELGHQMGLFHTTEANGLVTEPLSDTPECGLENDQDGNGILRADECAGHGADNVMFWEGDGDEVSAQQAAVLSRALILR